MFGCHTSSFLSLLYPSTDLYTSPAKGRRHPLAGEVLCSMQSGYYLFNSFLFSFMFSFYLIACVFIVQLIFILDSFMTLTQVLSLQDCPFNCLALRTVKEREREI